MNYSKDLEQIYALGLFGLMAVVALVYTLRVRLRGALHFDRVDRQGGSPLLSKSLMEMGYWSFQPVARLCVLCGLSANTLSLTSLFLGAVAGLCLAWGHFGSGAIFSAISSILDTLDGMVARLTHRSSNAGEVLDATVDRYCEFFFLGGLSIYYRLVPALLTLSLLALTGAFMVSYSSAKAEALGISPPAGSMRRPERAIYLMMGSALSAISIASWESDWGGPIAVGYPMVFACGLVAVLSHSSALERLFWTAREVRRQERSGDSPAASSQIEIGGEADHRGDHARKLPGHR